MGRTITELGFLYLLPFALYFAYLVVRRLYILSFDRWTRRVIAMLSAVGMALVLGALVLSGIFAEQHEGAYRPAHVENGRLVPGTIQ